MDEQNTPTSPTVPAIKPLNNNSLIPALIILVVILLVATGFLAYQNMQLQKQITKSQVSTYNSPVPSGTDETASWKTYTSVIQRISFQYPPTWVSVKPVLTSVSNDPNADEASFQSSNGEITINWVSIVSGLGGGCDALTPLGENSPTQQQLCPLITVIDKVPITTAPGLFVVSGTSTKDAKTYEPWLAIQDSRDGELTKTGRNMGYDEFSRDNGKTDALFSTGGIYASGPNLTQADASAWFNKPSVQEAKKILSTFKFTDQSQTDTSNWKTYTNDKYHYSFIYPSNWYLLGPPPDSTIAILTNYDSNNYSLHTNVNVFNSTDIKISVGSNSPTLISEPTTNMQEITFVGQPAKLITEGPNNLANTSKSQTIYVDKNGARYFINYVLGKNADESSAQKVLSTFKFTQ